MTFNDLMTAHNKVTEYRQQKDKLFRLMTLCGGTLYFDGHASIELGDFVPQVKKLLCTEQLRLCNVILNDVQNLGVDTSEEATELQTLTFKEQR